MSAERVALISARAYEIWEEEGRPEGSAERHWLQASAEVEAAEASDPAAFTGTVEAAEKPAPKPRAKRVTKAAAEPVVEKPAAKKTALAKAAAKPAPRKKKTDPA